MSCFFPYREEKHKLDLFLFYKDSGEGNSGKWFCLLLRVGSRSSGKKGLNFADCSSGVCPCVVILARPGYLSTCGNNRPKVHLKDLKDSSLKEFLFGLFPFLSPLAFWAFFL